MSKQKFQRGNIVRVLFGHPMWNGNSVTDMSPDEVGRLAVIEGSYADLYWGSNTSDYSIIFLDTGSSVAWKSENELEFIEDGGEHIIEQAKQKRDELKQQNRDLKYIKDNWEAIKYRVNSDTIIYLFEKIGYKSSFERNGEFFVLFHDWDILFPVFDGIFTGKIMVKTNFANDLEQKIFKLYEEVTLI